MSLAARNDDLDLGATAALAAARDHLLGLQNPAGWWKGELQTNVTMDAEDVLLRHFLGILDDETVFAAGAWIRSQQRSDGTWGGFFEAPGDLSTTVEAYVALRLCGDRPEEGHLMAAAAWIRDHGGLGGTRIFTRIWLAMVGQWKWQHLPVLPPEIMLLPPQAPLSIYNFGCWARQTIVALSVVMAHRPRRPLGFDLPELKATSSGAPGSRRQWTARSFLALDRILHLYEQLPAWVLPRTALRRVSLHLAEEWIIRRQEADGCWGGIQPPLVYSVIALHLQGYPLYHPTMRAAVEGMAHFIVDDEKGRRVEACQSPVWDTALATVALVDSGIDHRHPAVGSAADWLLEQEVRVRGDWAVRRPCLAPGGWSFEFANVNYPDIDDTAEVVMALRRVGSRTEGRDDEGRGDEGRGDEGRGEDAIRRAVAWTEGMQSRGGGWGAFDADNDSELCASLPFCDFGRVTDPPSSDVTAHVLEMLAAEPSAEPEVIRRGVAWLLSQQEADGSWFGRWGVNHLYGTGAAVPALVAAGLAADDPPIRRAVQWLEGKQNPDGGWGEDLKSYRDDSWRGRGASTASQTGWAILALLAAGERENTSVVRGISWLLETQTEDGTWDEPWFTGTGFPWDFTINYHLYRLVFPLTALGRYLNASTVPKSTVASVRSPGPPAP